MSAKHTPGPWKATARHVTAPETEDRLELRVTIGGGNRDDNRANARLIAAAPDLLEALEACYAALHPNSAEGKAASAAIAKATGSAQ